MNKDEALRLALEALESASYAIESWGSYASEYFQDKHDLQTDINNTQQAITAIKAALEAKDEPVGLIESLKDAKPCCGQYENCWRACTPRGKFIGQRDAQRKPLTDEEIRSIWNDGDCYEEIAFARAIEAAHGIKGEA